MRRLHTLCNPMARAVAMFLAAFALINLLGEALCEGFSLNLWWIDFRPLPTWLTPAVLAPAAVLLIAWSLRPHAATWRRRATRTAVAILLALAAWNVASFYLLLAQNRFQTSVPVPLSLLIAAAMAMILWALRPGETPPPARRTWAAPVAGLTVCLLAFPLLQMVFFGNGDYRRRADVIVVFGAGVYPDGRPSSALKDRVYAACTLYHQGLADTIIMSGGPGMGPVHETTAMRTLAIKLGVPAEHLRVDELGLNTQATVTNTCTMFPKMGVRRVLAVSHFYHLPRIKMTYQRAGWDVYTVAAPQRWRLRRMPIYMARETAALWAYYLHPLAG